MIATVLVIALASIAAVTDLRWQKIYNHTTYPGIVAALVLGGMYSLLEWRWPSEGALREFWSRVDLSQSGLGLLVCGGLMVLCYLWFRIGGGDVKLLAMVGTFLGVEQGLEALLWTFVLGGCCGLIAIVWQIGAWELARRTGRYLLALVKVGPTLPPESDRRLLQSKLYLGPCAPVAVAIVVFEMI